MKFRKKPVVVEARRVGIEGWNSIANWCGGEIILDGKKFACILIKTLEGTMRADDGDWIIRGVNGEHYPCKPDIFEKTYELVIEGENE